MICPFTGRSLAALPGPHTRIEVVDDISALPPDWSELVPADHPLLSRPLLDAAVQGAPDGTLARFVLAWDGDELRAVSLIEAVPLRLGTLGEITASSGWPLRAALQVLAAAHCGNPHVVVCGDVLRTDVAGCFISPDQPTPTGLLHQMIEAGRRDLSVSVALVICSARCAGPDSDALAELGYHRIDKAEPPMRVDLMPHWRGWDDYLQAMRKKYRQRARSARKRGRSLVREEVDLAGIQALSATFDALLAPVLERAPVTLVRPDGHTLVRLKRSLGDSLVVRVYRHEGEVVAFSSSIRTADSIEGFLVGFDEEHNRTLKIYQNILYDFIEEGLQLGVSSVCLGRTALEIKSAVGAVPTEIPLYVRHPSALLHPVLGWAAGSIPSPTWTPRNPFREQLQVAAR